MKTIKYYICLPLFVLSINVLAERKMPPTPAELHAKKWEYLIQTANLTPEEIKAVKPIYMKYEEGLWDLFKKNRSARKKNTVPNYEEMNEKYIEREVKQAEYLLNYHQELKKVLSPEVLHNYYKAERSHKRQLIYEIQNNHLKRKLKEAAK